MKMADTPDKLAHLQTLPQNKLFPTQKDGDTVSVFADAKNCKCVYVGSQPNYQFYQAIALQQHEVDEARDAAENEQMAQMNAQMNWGMWGAWRRPIIYP